MLTIGVSMMKNSIDIGPETVRHMLDHVDQVWVLDNNSTDGTGEALRSINAGKRLVVIDDKEIGYYQSAKMTNLANNAWAANSMRPCWFVPFDDDEWWEPVDLDMSIDDVLNNLSSEQGARIAEVKLYDYRCTSKDIHGALSPFDRMVWRSREPAPLPKVAVQWSNGCVIRQGNHSAFVPGEPAPTPAELIIRHYPLRSPEHMARKAVQGKQAYDATDLPFEQGQHWREWGAHYERGGMDAINEIFYEWYYFNDPASCGLVLDPARP